MSHNLRILIVGERDAKLQGPQVEELARLLAKEAISRGHILLTTCHTKLDDVVAETANDALLTSRHDPRDRIISYHPRHVNPSNSFGTVLKSEIEDW